MPDLVWWFYGDGFLPRLAAGDDRTPGQFMVDGQSIPRLDIFGNRWADAWSQLLRKVLAGRPIEASHNALK